MTGRYQDGVKPPSTRYLFDRQTFVFGLAVSSVLISVVLPVSRRVTMCSVKFADRRLLDREVLLIQNLDAI